MLKSTAITPHRDISSERQSNFEMYESPDMAAETSKLSQIAQSMAFP